MGRWTPLLVVVALLGAGCTFHAPSPPTPTPPSPPPPGPAPPVVTNLTVPDWSGYACGHLDVRADRDAFAVGENVTVLASFENCGDVPLEVQIGRCAGGRALLEGPVGGPISEGSVTVGAVSFGPCALGAGPKVAPGEDLNWSASWNGTWRQGLCSFDAGTGTPDCGAVRGAPAGRYRLVADVETVDGTRSWSAADVVNLLPWREPHGNWTEYHPAWRLAGDLVYRDQTMVLLPGKHGATDGSTWLLRGNGTLVPFANAPACLPDAPGNATWVMLSADPCRWAALTPGTG